MSLPTWRELIDFHCSEKTIRDDSRQFSVNPYHEKLANRRFNCSSSSDKEECRLLFLKSVLENPTNNTLVRNGRFIWCKSLKYEGVGSDGHRQISFSVDKGEKRFFVSENNVLCLPSKVYVNNNRFFRSKEKTFASFSSVFSYSKTLKMLLSNSYEKSKDLRTTIIEDNPYRPGTLVAPRLGYFYPSGETPEFLKTVDKSLAHPYGIILGPALGGEDYLGKEFYRVRFGGTTYERVHPVQMEIINEV